MKFWWLQVTHGYLSGIKHHYQKKYGIRIFFYHGIVKQKRDTILGGYFHLISDFRSQVSFLRMFRILGIDELLEILTKRSKYDNSKPAVVITFDDGYANNLIAAEILDKWRIPWILFVSTGALGRDRTIWPMELYLLLSYGNAKRVEALGRVWSLNTEEERTIAWQNIRDLMKQLPSPLRCEVMEEIRQQFPEGETQRLLEKFPSMQMLTWEEVRQLASAGVEIGSHGVNHEIHHQEQPKAVRLEELVRSKEEIEKQLNRSCRCFAYPNGDFTESSPKEVQEAGYCMAFTTQQRTVSFDDNLYLLPRLSAPKSLHSFVRKFFWDSKP